MFDPQKYRLGSPLCAGALRHNYYCVVTLLSRSCHSSTRSLFMFTTHETCRDDEGNPFILNTNSFQHPHTLTCRPDLLFLCNVPFVRPLCPIHTCTQTRERASAVAGSGGKSDLLVRFSRMNRKCQYPLNNTQELFNRYESLWPAVSAYWGTNS